MATIVQKYGGSSVADVDKIKQIAGQIAKKKNEGYKVAVVVSAMGKTTNGLIELAKSVCKSPDKREMDMLLSTGERITMSILCMALKDQGYDAISLTGSQAGIITNDCHNDAKVIEVRPFRVQDELDKGKIVVIGGFQGVSYKRDITTLGRGGSDTSAVALAAALDAESCEIYSDIDGIYTADPNIVENSKHLPEISFEMMQEMSLSGAKVLNSDAVQFAKEKNIAIYARSTFSSEKETIVRKLSNSIPNGIKAISSETNLVRCISTANKPSSYQNLLKFLEENNIPIKEASLNNTYSSIIFSPNNIYNYDQLINNLKENYHTSLLFEKISLLSLIGEGVNNNPSISNKTIALLNNNNIEQFGLTITSLKLSFILKPETIEKAVKVCHSYWIENNE